jgi:hypothetical protein
MVQNDTEYVEQYAQKFRALLAAGWDDELDIDHYLPKDLMPKEHFERYNK